MARGEMRVTGGSHLRGRHRGIAGESKLRPLIVPEDTTTRMYQNLHPADSNFVVSVVFINPVGPIKVAHRGTPRFNESGVLVEDLCLWGCRETGPDEVTFFAHPSYTGGNIVVNYDPKVCRLERMYAEPTTIYSFPGV